MLNTNNYFGMFIEDLSGVLLMEEKKGQNFNCQLRKRLSRSLLNLILNKTDKIEVNDGFSS